jgi:hypothetical protein
LNQSGTAKEVDRDELNNFVFGIARHLVEHIMRPIYKWCSFYRYRDLVGDSFIDLVPKIVVPKKFGILTENIIAEQLKQMRDADGDPSIISELEIEYASKKFNNDKIIKEKVKCIKQLDPFPTKTNQEKLDLMLSGKIDEIDFIISVYINSFIERAISEDENFVDLDFPKKQEVLMKMAEEKRQVNVTTPVFDGDTE